MCISCSLTLRGAEMNAALQQESSYTPVLSELTIQTITTGTAANEARLKVAYVSDLHLDHKDGKWNTNDFISDADVLVIAGDLSSKGRGYDFLMEMCSLYKHVIFVLGNHDFWGREFYNFKLSGVDNESLPKNLHMIPHRKEIIIDDVVFLCGPMWTDYDNSPYIMAEAQLGMNDFNFMQTVWDKGRKIIPSDLQKEHFYFVEWLKERLHVNEGRKIVVVTHHAPSEQSCDPMFKRSNLNPAYFSNLEYILKEYPLVWVHGHVHYLSAYNIGDSIVLCNPTGYYTNTVVLESFLI